MFFMSPLQAQPGPMKPVGDQNNNQTKDEENGIPPTIPLDLTKSNPEQVALSDKIGVTLSKSVLSEDRHRRGGGGGDRNNGDEGGNDNESYDLKLFEGSEQSDGIVDLGQEVKAVATTDDSIISQVTFTWVDPTLDVAESILATLNSSGAAEDTFEPDQPGQWRVEANFGNGQVVIKTLNVQFFVIPESPLGVFLLITSSIASLGGYVYYRKLRNERK